MKKIEHIGIAVQDLKKSTDLFSKIFQKESYKTEVIDSEGVVTNFFKIGQSKIELIASIENNSAIDKYLKKNRQGMHHIAFYVDDIYHEIKRLKQLGIRCLNETPKQGADNKLICFLHPHDTSNVLIELCQEID